MGKSKAARNPDTTLQALRQYLADSAEEGNKPAEAGSIVRFAPGVFGVMDTYDGTTEYDIYYALDKVAFVNRDWTTGSMNETLPKMGMNSLCYGGLVMGFAALFEQAKRDIVLAKGVSWHSEPVSVDP